MANTHLKRIITNVQDRKIFPKKVEGKTPLRPKIPQFQLKRTNVGVYILLIILEFNSELTRYTSNK